MRETDIRPAKFAKKIAYYAREDKKLLKKYKSQFVSVPCPACGSKDFKKAFTKYQILFVACKNCQTVYASPRPTAKILKEYYQKAKNYQYWNKYVFPASEKNRLENIVKPRADLILDYCRKLNINTGSLIEVGAGFGTFCLEIKKRKRFKQIIAIELTPDLAHTCRQRGLTVIEKPIEEIKPNQLSTDIIVSFETIEHLYSPLDFITAAVNILNKKGLIILTCPNMLGLETMILQTKSKSVGGEHINMFNPESIRILLKRCNLKVIKIMTPGKLDLDLIRNAVSAKEYDIKNQPFLKYLLFDQWELIKNNFQKILQDNLLSSHMLVIAQKK